MNTLEENVRSQFKSLLEEGLAFFDKIARSFEGSERSKLIYADPDHYWSKVSQDLRDEAHKIIAGLIPLAQKVAAGCKSSLLMGDADLRDLAVEVKRMRAALRLRQYHHSDPEGIYDDYGERVLGFRPESQEERGALRPEQAVGVWRKSGAAISRLLEMVDQRAYSLTESTDFGASPVRRYKPNSAFIMMWMDLSQPDLVDVRDAVSETFTKFGVRALRADEIEHDGVITQRILDEIRSAEFLFADLTGARPNVYYEVGYAHALGKRVMLFRKKGTGLHFDLAGYNCPEYDNLRDLKEKLKKRLESVTNKQPESAD